MNKKFFIFVVTARTARRKFYAETGAIKLKFHEY